MSARPPKLAADVTSRACLQFDWITDLIARFPEMGCKYRSKCREFWSQAHLLGSRLGKVPALPGWAWINNLVDVGARTELGEIASAILGIGSKEQQSNSH
jgi:hypothetical protein